MREESLSRDRFPIHFCGLYCLKLESNIMENENALSAWWLVEAQAGYIPLVRHIMQ